MLWKSAGGPTDLGMPGHLGNVPAPGMGRPRHPVLAQIHEKTSFLLTFPVYPETRGPMTQAPFSQLWDVGSG